MAIISVTEPIEVLTAIATVGPLIVELFGGVVAKLDVDVDSGLDLRLKLERLGPKLVVAELMAEEEELVPSTAVAEFARRDGDALETRGLGVTEEAKLLDEGATTTSSTVVIAEAGLFSEVVEASMIDAEEKRMTVAAHEHSSPIYDEV